MRRGTTAYNLLIVVNADMAFKSWRKLNEAMKTTLKFAIELGCTFGPAEIEAIHKSLKGEHWFGLGDWILTHACIHGNKGAARSYHLWAEIKPWKWAGPIDVNGQPSKLPILCADAMIWDPVQNLCFIVAELEKDRIKFWKQAEDETKEQRRRSVWMTRREVAAWNKELVARRAGVADDSWPDEDYLDPDARTL